MIYVKSRSQIDRMKKANLIVRDTLDLLMTHAKEGVSTWQLDQMAYEFIVKHGATPSFLHYHGFPASICVSIDEQVVHGIPSKKRLLQEGEIVSFDVGAILDGWHGDAARTVGIGRVSPEKQRLMEVTEQCFFEGIKVFDTDHRLGDIGHAIQTHAEQNGYGVVRALVGHGIGRELHEDPEVPNFGHAGRGIRLAVGMVLAIEPMITLGDYEVNFGEDGWTVTTCDKLSASHYENTVALTENGIEILSL